MLITKVDRGIVASREWNNYVEARREAWRKLSGEEVAAVAKLAGRRVVLVDSYPDLVDVAARRLRSLNIQVTTTCSHQEAFDRICARPPDVLISNIGSGEGAGFDLIERIRSAEDLRVACLPALALSGSEEPEVIERAFERGFDLFLPKPASLRELVQALAVIIPPR